MRGTSCAPPIVSIHLDPVCTFADLLTHDPRQAVRPIGFLGALGHGPFGSVTLWAVATGRYNCAGNHHHSRARNDSLLHWLLQSYVRITRYFRAEVANRCGTPLQ